MKCKNFALAFLALPLLLNHSRAADKITQEKLESQGRKRVYYLMVPDSVKSAASVPLIVLLHGSGRNGLSLMEKWKEIASREGIIIAGPDAQDKIGWQIPIDGPGFINDLIEALRAKYPINPHRIYLFGHSAGAVFALNLSMMESEYFAATAVHAGSWRSEKELSAIEYAKRKTPMAIFVGDRDAFFPLQSVKATEAALKERGFPIEVSIMKGHDHWYYDLAPQINRNAWDFLKQRELNENPKYEAYNFAVDVKGGNTGTKDINELATQIKTLSDKATEKTQVFYAKERELIDKDFVKDKAVVVAIAREQIESLKASAALFREAADKAERLGKSPVGSVSQYYAIVAQLQLKRVEICDAMRERAELVLSEDQADTIISKRNDIVRKVDILNREVIELEQKVERVRGGQGR